jgi:hypothetical protein
MAGEAMYMLVDVSHNAAAIAGATYMRFAPDTVFRIDPGPPGQLYDNGVQVTHREVGVEVYGAKNIVLAGLLVAGTHDLVAGVLNGEGVIEDLTISSVRFTRSLGSMTFLRGDTGGKVPEMGVGGWAHFAAGEGFSDVLSALTRES